MSGRFDQVAIDVALAELNADATAPWQQQGNAIRKDFRFKDFQAAFRFMHKVAEAAEAMDHHPDWCNSYARVSVELSTHSAGGLTSLDFTLAAHMETIAKGFLSQE